MPVTFACTQVRDRIRRLAVNGPEGLHVIYKLLPHYALTTFMPG